MGTTGYVAITAVASVVTVILHITRARWENDWTWVIGCAATLIIVGVVWVYNEVVGYSSARDALEDVTWSLLAAFVPVGLWRVGLLLVRQVRALRQSLILTSADVQAASWGERYGEGEGYPAAQPLGGRRSRRH